MSTYNQKMDYNCTKQAAYSIKKTTKKALLSKSMSTYTQHKQKYELDFCQAGSLEKTTNTVWTRFVPW